MLSEATASSSAPRSLGNLTLVPWCWGQSRKYTREPGHLWQRSREIGFTAAVALTRFKSS